MKVEKIIINPPRSRKYPYRVCLVLKHGYELYIQVKKDKRVWIAYSKNADKLRRLSYRLIVKGDSNKTFAKIITFLKEGELKALDESERTMNRILGEKLC